MTLLDVIDLDEMLTANSIVKPQIFKVMDESGRDFGLEVMRKSKLKKKKKNQKNENC